MRTTNGPPRDRHAPASFLRSRFAAFFGASATDAMLRRMADPKPKKSWPSLGAFFLGRAESAVLILIGLVLVVLAVLMLGSAIMEVKRAVHDGQIHESAIAILDRVLLVMMTMEIVYTVAISLEAHALVAEPFLIIGAIAAIRRMLVITATSTDIEGKPMVFRNTLIELALL